LQVQSRLMLKYQKKCYKIFISHQREKNLGFGCT
jgi:hypothetical protein